MLSAAVGLVGGALAAAYYYVLEGGLYLVWDVLAEAVGPVWIVTALGGLLVGLTLKYMGVPGEIAAVVDNIHLRRGRIDVRQTPSMIVASLLSISFGGSAGPEAPLVQIIGSLGSWLGDRLRLYGHLVRTLTFCGMAAALGLGFIGLFRASGTLLHRFQTRPVLLATAGGLALGLLASAFPRDLPTTVLFWGEYEARDLLLDAGTLVDRFGAAAIGLLLLLALGKAVAIALTLHTGFRGGFIFPLFFIGAAVGLALSAGTGGAIPVAVATLCLMAALNVAVTRTPISTTVILTTLSGTSMVPVIGAASLVSFLLTTPVSLIRTQRPRRHHPPGRVARGGRAGSEGA